MQQVLRPRLDRKQIRDTGMGAKGKEIITRPNINRAEDEKHPGRRRFVKVWKRQTEEDGGECWDRDFDFGVDGRLAGGDERLK